MKRKVKVLIVDDSAFMRKLISDFLNSDTRIDVVGTARNGEDALRKVAELNPDVITMDVEMPVMNGLDALKAIMQKQPIPVVMVSSTTQEGAENTFKAMELGAIDFITKPSGAISLDLHKVKEEIIYKVYNASKANLKVFSVLETQEKKELRKILGKPHVHKGKIESKDKLKKIVCIGTSTGGPRALQEVLTTLPREINVPIMIVQHMPPSFTKSLADRLNSLSQIHVKEAEEGEIIQKGTAYVAPGGYHMKVKRFGSSLTILLEQSEPRNGHMPSVDVLFESISETPGLSKVAVVMTGMGTDGTKGLIRLKDSGETVAIAESEESSVVFGMPKSAISTNLVNEVVHLKNISSSILNYI